MTYLPIKPMVTAQNDKRLNMHGNTLRILRCYEHTYHQGEMFMAVFSSYIVTKGVLTRLNITMKTNNRVNATSKFS